MQIPVHIFFEKENIRTDSMDSELFLTILSAMAESESVSISENNKWAVQHRFMTGTYKQSYAPFGYDSVGDTLVINPAEAEIVRRIFAETLSGKSAEAVAKALNTEGILPRIGKQWGATSVRKILCNEKYKGDALFQKTYTDNLCKFAEASVPMRIKYNSTKKSFDVLNKNSYTLNHIVIGESG